MNFYSTNNTALSTDFKTAVFQSLPADGGLYMPNIIPQFSKEFLTNLPNLSLREIAFETIQLLLEDAIPKDDLKKIIEDAFNFDAPVVDITNNISVLELFHGPSLAFKDFGARFMSRIMAYLKTDSDKPLDILVATSGDTGGAVALGFLGVKGTRVTILYPKGKVSPIQEKQLTSNGQNIRAIEVNGTFDDCQAMVKKAFVDAELNQELQLTSANSINISRLIPQTIYFINAVAQLERKGINEVIFSVPSGNFGNIGAGILAYKMGLKVKHFIAATNSNDTVPRFLKNGKFEPKHSVQTISNAMDVGNPSNWVRIQDMFKNDLDEINQTVSAYSYNDKQTIEGIKQLAEEYQYIACPHTAIAFLAAKQYQIEKSDQTSKIVFLSTAHSCKFLEVFPENLQARINIPEDLKGEYVKQNFYSIENEYLHLKTLLIAEK